MELIGIDIPVWFINLLLVICLLYRYLTSTFDTFTKLGIPGPKPIPLLGTTHHFKKGVVQHDVGMHKKYGKIVGLFNSRTPVLMINDVEILKHILVKDFSSFRNRQAFPLDPPFDMRVTRLQDDHWKFVRTHVSSTFTGQRLRNMIPALNKCSMNLVHNLSVSEKAGDAFDTKEYMASFTMDVIASTAFSIDIDTQNDKNNIFVRMANKLFDKDKKWLLLSLITAVPSLGLYLPSIGIEVVSREAVDFFVRVVRKAIEDREENPEASPKDFLQLLLASRLEEDDVKNSWSEGEQRQGLTEQEVLAQCLLFFLAGHQNTSITLTFTLYSLALNPKYQQRAYEEIINVFGKDEDIDYDRLKNLTYLEMCISEALRMYPVEPRSDRLTNKEITIQGVHIPKGCMIVFPIYVLHHDPEAWPEPEIFDPERFTPEAKSSRHEYQYMPFGAGPRRCAADRFALVQTKVVLAQLIRRFKFVPCEKTPKMPLEMKSNKTECKHTVWLKVEQR